MAGFEHEYPSDPSPSYNGPIAPPNPGAPMPPAGYYGPPPTMGYPTAPPSPQGSQKNGRTGVGLIVALCVLAAVVLLGGGAVLAVFLLRADGSSSSAQVSDSYDTSGADSSGSGTGSSSGSGDSNNSSPPVVAGEGEADPVDSNSSAGSDGTAVTSGSETAAADGTMTTDLGAQLIERWTNNQMEIDSTVSPYFGDSATADEVRADQAADVSKYRDSMYDVEYSRVTFAPAGAGRTTITAWMNYRRTRTKDGVVVCGRVLEEMTVRWQDPDWIVTGIDEFGPDVNSGATRMEGLACN